MRWDGQITKAHVEMPGLDGIPSIPVFDGSDFRCPRCGKLLMVAKLTPGTVCEIKCTRSKCGTYCRFARVGE